ncbi:MAG: hypothetical protein ACLQDC_07620, partial [Verrucomicrobiia bacterium]
MKIENRTTSLLIGLAAFLLTTSTLRAAEPDRKAWLEDWQKKNPQWRALHMSAPRPDSLPRFKQLIAESLAPTGINVL